MFSAPEFRQTPHAPSGVHPGQALPQHLGVDEEPVVAKEIREPAAVGVRGLAVGFEAAVAADEEAGQPLVRLPGEGRRSFEATSEFGRVDAEQPHAARVPEFDGVTIEDALHGVVVRGGDNDGRRHQRGSCKPGRGSTHGPDGSKARAHGRAPGMRAL